MTSSDGPQVLRWICPRPLRLLHELRDPLAAVLGFDEAGRPKSSGPFWAVRGCQLAELMAGMTECELRPDESSRAEEAVAKLARQGFRELHGSQFDYVELFQTSPTATALRQRGLRLPPPHQSFTTQVGWNASSKDHRRRFRSFLDKQRPGVVHVNLPSAPSSTISSQQLAEQAVLFGFAMEVIREQVEQGRRVVVEASAESEFWTCSAWMEFRKLHGLAVRLHQPDNRQVASNLPWFFGLESSGPESLGLNALRARQLRMAKMSSLWHRQILKRSWLSASFGNRISPMRPV